MVRPKYVVISYNNGEEISEVIRTGWAMKKNLLRFTGESSVETFHNEALFPGILLAYGGKSIYSFYSGSSLVWMLREL